jgi:hypothetical protein
MRFLKCDSRNQFSLTEDLTTDIPPYAILSHTWGSDADEVTYKDLIDKVGKDKLGYKKLEFCAKQAKHHHLSHFWVDTCCIDKSDPIEVQRSINSMFRWYRDASRCYVYLSDVTLVYKQEQDSEQFETMWKSALRTSRWFKRGWTLQELLAPASVEFFAEDGQCLGDKQSVEQEIHEITGIAVRALRDNQLSRYSVDERFKWAENRETKHEEDWAYCLLGIFGVFMPLIYGEGKDHAIRRLRREIDEASKHERVTENQEGLPAERFETPPSPTILIPFSRDREFVKRQSLLDQVSKICGRLGSWTALVGLGGVGYAFCPSIRSISS